jgi:hypothetical protein
MDDSRALQMIEMNLADMMNEASSDDDDEVEEDQDPCLYQPFLEDTIGEFQGTRYDIDSPELPTHFLKKIANEDVRYESDSEAADSWAQSGGGDGNSGLLSTGSSGNAPALTCDPARLALREIMNRVPHSFSDESSPPPPPPPPPPPRNSPIPGSRQSQSQ